MSMDEYPGFDYPHEQPLLAAREYIRKLETAIRKHRDQKGNDRCTWVDDHELYSVLPEGDTSDTKLPPKDVWLRECGRMWDCRQAPKDGPYSALPHLKIFDHKYLDYMCVEHGCQSIKLDMIRKKLDEVSIFGFAPTVAAIAKILNNGE